MDGIKGEVDYRAEFTKLTQAKELELGWLSLAW